MVLSPFGPVIHGIMVAGIDENEAAVVYGQKDAQFE